MVRILHAADVHLDSPMKGLERYEGAPVERLRVATRQALERLVSLAVAERVDVLLLAGDLFDGDGRDYRTCLHLREHLTRLRDEGIQVVAIKGNHDAANKMTHELRPPENVHLLDSDQPQTITFDDLGLAIHGQSYATGAVTCDLTRGYPRAIPGLFNMGLLHTAVAGCDGHEPYAPCTVEGLRSKGYDYWALGHVHTRQTLCEDPFIVFPGNLQGRHIRETGEKGAILVEVGRNHPAECEFRRLDVLRWELCAIPGASFDSEDALMEQWNTRLNELLRSESEDHLLAIRLVVDGPCTMHSPLQARPQRLSNELRGMANDLGRERVWVEQVRFRTQPMRNEPVPDGPLRELAAVIQELRDSEVGLRELTAELADLATKVGPHLEDVPDGPATQDPVWLRELLDSIEPLLLDRITAAQRGELPS